MRISAWVISGVAVWSCLGCGPEGALPVAKSIQFEALVGGRAFACGTTYAGLGTTGSTFEPLDFKAFIYNPQLRRSDGTLVPLTLRQDGKWQRDRVALLDFEDGTGLCETGSPETRTVVEGTVPAYQDYVGVQFQVGLPPELNHLDAATAPPPYNTPGMWWSWAGGYKFMRLDGKTRGNPAYYFHLGATSCSGTPSQGFTCKAPNVPEISLVGMKSDSLRVRFDVAKFYAASDLDQQIDGKTDFISGCMAFAGDPECPAVFSQLGLSVDATATPVGQSIFEVAP
jgi:uncharacterized repeat protein (TIGR04052 family)